MRTGDRKGAPERGKAGPWERCLIALILAGLLIALVAQARRVGITVDEPIHLLSSYLYWRGAEPLQPSDMPPLIKIIGGWVPRLLGLPVPSDLGKVGDDRGEWLSAVIMMDRMSGRKAETVFFYSRLTLLVFPLLTALLIWRWGRQLFGPPAGVLAALAYALEPTVLAHSSLYKNDLAATFTYLLFWFCAWKFWRNPRRGLAACLGAATLLAALSKMSMLFLIAVAPCLILVRYATRREQGLRTAAAALLLVLAIPYLGMLAACQFDTRRIPAAELAALAQDPLLPKPFVLAAQVFRVLPVPRPLWTGCLSLLHDNSSPPSVYMLGQVYPGGSPLYFLVALAVKIPASLQILLCAGLALAVAGLVRRALQPADALWLLPGFLYVGLASLSSLQLGVRLILPALPFGLLLCGSAMGWLWRGEAKLIPACLLVWLAFTSARAYPHGISFFNIWAGGPKDGLRYLADSNVDWGQGLPELYHYFHAGGFRKMTLSYFGTDNPWRYFTDRELELIAPPWSGEFALADGLKPQPGYYAISASLLPGHFFETKYRNYYRVFRESEPIARVADSIYVYKVGL